MLLLVLPAQAVVVTCVKESSEVLRIDYSAADEAVLPIAFAIDIAVDGIATIENVYDYKVGDSNTADPGYGIFPNSMQIDENGNVIDWGTPVVGPLGGSTVTLQMASRYSGSENAPLRSDILCRIRINPNGAADVNVTITRNVTGGGVVLENGLPASFNGQGGSGGGGGGPLGVRVTKCTVRAGSKPSSDSISVSGYIDGAADAFSGFGSAVATITSADIVSPCLQTFPIDGATYKNGQFKSTKTASPLRTSLTVNTRTSKFTFSARNVSLKGLSSPLNFESAIGASTAATEVNETIINGKSRPIPIKLMMGVKDSLRIDKFTAKRRATTDYFTVRGGFAVQNTGVNMVNEPFIVTLGGQTFTIPAGSFKANRSGFACSRITLADDSVAAASFNFARSAFTLTIKNTKIEAGEGSAGLRLNFALFDQVNQVNLPQVIPVNPPQDNGDDDEGEDDDDDDD